MAGVNGMDLIEARGTGQKSQFKTEAADLLYFGQEEAVCLLGQKAMGGAGGGGGRQRVWAAAAHEAFRTLSKNV